MIYTWRCKCGHQVEVERRLKDCGIGPTGPTQGDKGEGSHLPLHDDVEWKKIITVTPVMFEMAYDSGVLERVWKHPNL